MTFLTNLRLFKALNLENMNLRLFKDARTPWGKLAINNIS